MGWWSMQALRRLSLQAKFLVAPAIGLALMLLLAAVLVLAARGQRDTFTHLERHDMATAETLIQLFGALSANHARLSDLLVNEATTHNEAELYELGKPFIYAIHSVEQTLGDQDLAHRLHESERPLYRRLGEELAGYRSHAISAVEMATVDRALALGHMQRAADHYNQVDRQFLALLDQVSDHAKAEFRRLREGSERDQVAVAVIFLVALVSTFFAGLYLSRLLSGDLNALIRVMGRLASGEKDAEIPALASSREVTAVAQALEVFRGMLFDLDRKTRETQLMNDSLEQEVAERKRAEAGLQLAASVFKYSSEGIMITDADARIVSVNRAFSDITGYTEEEVVGQTPRLLRSDRHSPDFYRSLWESLRTQGGWEGEIWNRRRNGEVYPEWRNISAVYDERGEVTRYISIFSDITDKKLSEERIYRLAHYDVLTELPNRALFQERLEQALIKAKRGQRRVAVLFLDLDRFKLVNDTLGHSVGDKLLETAGGHLRGCVREQDTVARLGGDEFTVVLDDLDSAEAAAVVAQKVLDVLSQPMTVLGNEVFVTASVGISVYPDDAEDAKTLLRNADTAMYRVKEQGKNGYSFFTEEMNAAAVERLLMETQLRKAVDEGCLSLQYQPRVEVAGGQIVGMEALLRWRDPRLGAVPPNRFIPIAEDTGLIVPIGKWVLRAACQQYRRWEAQGVAPPVLSVNLSGRQLSDPRLIHDIKQIAEETGVRPECIELELTESFLMDKPQETVHALHRLKAIGFHIAVDDFGTAYSSLAYLKRFPVDTLKIDRSFVRDIPEDPEDVEITRAIVSLGTSLKLRVVAEGVETRQQLQVIRDCGCTEMQGYLFSRPVDAEQATMLLSADRAWEAVEERCQG